MKLLKLAGLVLIFLVFSNNVLAGSLFSDVYDSDPASVSIQYLLDEGVVEGYGDGTFRPLTLINRAEFTKMIVEGVAGMSPDENEFRDCFPDVTDGWYAKYVCYAKNEGWIDGYEDGYFKPSDKITRIEAIKILVEAYGWKKLDDFEYSYFYDIELDSWYEPYLAVWESRGLFDKLGHQLSPRELISRRQMSEMLYRAMKYEDGKSVKIRELTDGDLSYQEILDTEIQPAFPPEMVFPANSQKGWPYGCYTFAVKNLMQFKYDQSLNIADVQERIGWDGEFIWEDAEFDAFAREYNVDIIMNYNRTAEFLFEKLAMGEPMVIYMPYYSGGENIGHQVVAYSFDDEGLWVADSLSSGSRHRLTYDQVFLDGDNSTTNLTEIRLLGAAGQKKTEVPPIRLYAD